MEWRDEAILLGARRHGEAGIVASLMTRAHGRHAGLVRGGQSRRLRGVLQPGNRLTAHWRARLEEHLGSLTVELSASHAAALMLDAGRLSALTAALALVEAGLAEREPHPHVYESLDALMTALQGPDWARTYVRWEVGLLGDLGFGLDLSACAATGVTEDLVYLSPKTGRAVSREAGRPYRERLFRLPAALGGPGAQGGAQGAAQGGADLADALALSGHFLARHVFDPQGKPMPDARARLEARFRKEAAA